MSFIHRELERIAAALSQPQSAIVSAELYAAQQALAWATEPDGFARPSAMLMGTPEGSEGCQPSFDPEPS